MRKTFMRCLQFLQFLMLQIFSNNFLESFLFPFFLFTFIPFLLMLLIRLDLYLSIPLLLHFNSLLADAFKEFLTVQSFSCLSIHLLFNNPSPDYLSVSCLSISCLSIHLLFIYPSPVYLSISCLE